MSHRPCGRNCPTTRLRRREFLDSSRDSGWAYEPVSGRPGPLRPRVRARCLWRRLRGHADRRPGPLDRGQGPGGAAQPGSPRRHRCRSQDGRRGRHLDAGAGRFPARRGAVRPAPPGGLRGRQRVPAAPIPSWPPRRRRASSRSPPRSTSRVLGWRVVPTDDGSLSDLTRSNMPHFEQLFVTASGSPLMGLALERLAYCLRRRAQHETGVYFASLSCRTLNYKGMLTPEQLSQVYPELLDERMASALAVVHSRFSTNTFPAWELAHPFRMIAHNGEINTVKGNRNWMRARETLLASDVIPGDLERLFPICTPDASDSASFDEVVELLHLGGRSLAHAMLMMIPEAWENNEAMEPAAAGLLRLPLLPDGAVGRTGRRGVHRRHADRCRAGPQRPAPRAVLGDERRTGRTGVGGRRARHRPGHGRAEGTAAAGQDVPRRHRRAPADLRRGGQGQPGRGGAVRGVAASRVASSSRICPSGSTSCTPTPR